MRLTLGVAISQDSNAARFVLGLNNVGVVEVNVTHVVLAVGVCLFWCAHDFIESGQFELDVLVGDAIHGVVCCAPCVVVREYTLTRAGLAMQGN